MSRVLPSGLSGSAGIETATAVQPFDTWLEKEEIANIGNKLNKVMEFQWHFPITLTLNIIWR